MSDKEQVKPLAPGASSLRKTAPTDTTAAAGEPRGDVEVARRDKPSKRRRRCAVCCCACCGVTVVALGLLVLILALTVFKVKDAVMTMNSIAVDGVNVGFLEALDGRPLTVNATVTADISIKNPNAASFRFRNSTTEFYYGGQTVGVAYAPSGNARAHRTVRMNVTVDVFADRVMAVAAGYPNVTLDVLQGSPVSVNLTSYTAVKGRVSVWGIYKKNMDMRMNCTMTLEYVLLQRQEITNKVCKATVK